MFVAVLVAEHCSVLQCWLQCVAVCAANLTSRADLSLNKVSLEEEKKEKGEEEEEEEGGEEQEEEVRYVSRKSRLEEEAHRKEGNRDL